MEIAIVISSFVVIITIFFVIYFRQQKYDEFILQNSLCLKQLTEINSRYNFFPYINFNQRHSYDNENYYNTISCTDYLIYQLQFIGRKLCDQIGKLKNNKLQYSKYLNEVKDITQFGRFQSEIGKLKLGKLIKHEKRLIAKETYRAPTTKFSLTVTLLCSKINGDVYDRKSEAFYADDILALVRRVNNKRGSFYNDRGIWDAICRVERGKVSNKMRFSIYERDGYQCRKCGVSDRNASLEIDHIIPISKGGKSTYDNLQTLCHECNVKKGAKIDYNFR